MTLDNLLRIGKLRAHVADKVEIARLLHAAERALPDAAVLDVSADTRLDAAYRAIMAAALVAMLANGYRPVLGAPCCVSRCRHFTHGSHPGRRTVPRRQCAEFTSGACGLRHTVGGAARQPSGTSRLQRTPKITRRPCNISGLEEDPA